MQSRKARASDDQIEAEVLATLDDPFAWEELPFVPASSSPRPAWMLKRKRPAGTFHVLSALRRAMNWLWKRRD
jgi:hypothetical protein